MDFGSQIDEHFLRAVSHKKGLWLSDERFHVLWSLFSESFSEFVITRKTDDLRAKVHSIYEQSSELK